MTVELSTPVSYVCGNKSLLQSIGELADDYFDYGGLMNRAFVIGIEDGKLVVQFVECRSNSCLMTALKIASLFTGVIPALMLLAKAVSRYGNEYKILNPESTPRKAEFVPLVNQKKKPFVFDEAMQSRYREVFRKAGIEPDQATPLQQHAVFFTNENGEFTRESIQKGFERLHFSKFVSFIAGRVLFIGLASKMGEKNGALFLKDLHKGKHASDTGAFTSNGEFDASKFNEVRDRFAKVDRDFLTASELGQMRAENRKRDQGENDATAGAVAAKGEFDTLLSLFADGNVVDREGNVIPTITMSRLHDFYTAGPKLFEEVAAQ